MNIAIIGQGALASLYAYYLKELKPQILTRAKPFNRKLLIDLDGNKIDLPLPSAALRDAHQQKYQLILICVKHYHMPDLLADLHALVEASTSLLLIQNGMGGAALLQKKFPLNNILVGVCTDAVFAKSATAYQVSAYGKLDIGRYNRDSNQGDSKAVFDVLKKFHPNVHVHENILPALYKKLAINAAINPISAIYQVKNGEVLNHQEELEALEDEIGILYKKLDINIDIQALKKDIRQVIKLTRDNNSSMLQDILFGRQTEIEGILGYLLLQADELKLKLPKIRNLYERVLALQEQK